MLSMGRIAFLGEKLGAWRDEVMPHEFGFALRRRAEAGGSRREKAGDYIR